LQPLDLAVLGTGDRLGVGQGGQGLVAVAGRQQALQVVTEPAALSHACKQRVELGGVVLQRAGRGRAGRRAVIGGGSWRRMAGQQGRRTLHRPQQTTDKPALVATWIARITWRLQEAERHPGKAPLRAPTAGFVQQCVGIGATVEEDTDNGRGTLGIVVNEVCLHVSQAPVDGVLRRRVEVILLEVVAVTVEPQRVMDAGRDRHLDHVSGFHPLAVDTPFSREFDLARHGLTCLPASVLARAWSSEEARALFGGVAAHALRDLSTPMSSAIGVALTTAAHAYGWPVAQGGSSAISAAMVAALEELGGKVITGVRVDSLDELDPADVVMLDVTPRAAVRIVGAHMPGRICRALGRYRHGPDVFKVDLAVEGGCRGGTSRRGMPAPCTSPAATRRSRSPSARWRAVGCRPVRSCWLASSTSPTHPGRWAAPTRSMLTPTSRPATAGTPPRRSRSRSSGSLPDFASASSPGTSARPPRWRRAQRELRRW
jgi:hypothetical protein